MADHISSALREKFIEALSASIHHDDVEFSNVALDWIDANLSNLTTEDVLERLRLFIEQGGEIDQVQETRPEWKGDRQYHYDARFPIDGRATYIEMRLNTDRRIGPPELFIANVHGV